AQTVEERMHACAGQIDGRFQEAANAISSSTQNFSAHIDRSVESLTGRFEETGSRVEYGLAAIETSIRDGVGGVAEK
ncbi:hypothetical protein ACC760_40065, partial [Rhizobium ruizarguesonis]